MHSRTTLALVILHALSALHPAARAQGEPKPAVQGLARFDNVVAAIDAEVKRRLVAADLPASPPASDAEFLRRVTLDLTGCLLTYERTVAFLQSQDPDKRRRLIDELLASPAYALHFATIWRNLMVPLDLTSDKPTGRDLFTPWLAEQFQRNRGWHEIVTELLTIEGSIKDTPGSAFLLANSENQQPQAPLLTNTTARLFLGVQLQCAQCHDHPFAAWKQEDYWGLAAFFSRVRNTSNRGQRDAAFTETPPAGATAATDARIAVPTSAGKIGGKTVTARFLGGAALPDVAGPLRPRLASWLTATDNPYFATAAVNRLWAHFFGRGFVHPVDNLHPDNSPSHPELLKRLAAEFTTSGYDLKHLMRCICASEAYQRTSRPLPENADDHVLLSHMRVKALTPDVHYNILLMGLTFNSPEPPRTGKANAKPLFESREDFVRAYRMTEEPNADELPLGIPQMLRLLNAPQWNVVPAWIDQLAQSTKGSAEVIDMLYLVTLARRPSEQEAHIMTDYLARRSDRRTGYAGLLWILLNSSEFVLNH